MPSSPLVVDLPRPLEPGDRICVRGARHLAVQFDPNLGERLLHVPDGRLVWTIPAAAVENPSAKTPYPPSIFQSDRPRLTVRPVALMELDAYRNIAANPYDLRGAAAIFPHATAISEQGNDPVYAARNAIDGQRHNASHGGWPYQSWDAGNTDQTPWWQVDFGRVVEIDKVVIVLRGGVPRDSDSLRATLILSNGRRRSIELKKTAEPQTFTFEAQGTSSLRLVQHDRAKSPGWSALTEVEVWGRDRIPVAADLSTPVR
jgi:hypothetical protein